MKDTIFLETFGDSPINRVLDFLVVNEDFDYSMTDIAKFSRIGYSTLKLFWNKLERNKIVIHSIRLNITTNFKFIYFPGS